MRTPTLLLAAAAGAAGLAVSVRPLHAEDDGPRRSSRALHDVRVRIRLLRPAVGAARVRVDVRNRGRSPEHGVVVSVASDGDPSSPLWTTTTDLRRAGHRRWTLVLEVPAGTERLLASATLEEGVVDEHPEDNEAATRRVVTGGYTPDSVVAGAAIWSANCASCHGADGRGGTVDEVIAGHSAKDILEAAREGEEEMPEFPGLTLADAQAIAAYLENPGAVPAPGTGGGAGGAAPTYTNAIAAFLSARCTACHAGAGAPGGVRLDRYAYASANAARSLAAMQAGRMPPTGTLSAAELETFQAWIDAGTPR